MIISFFLLFDRNDVKNIIIFLFHLYFHDKIEKNAKCVNIVCVIKFRELINIANIN